MSTSSLADNPKPSSEIETTNVVRPTGNFHRSVWGDHFLNYTPIDEDVFASRKQERELLKSEVRGELLNVADRSSEAALELIDTLERLGVAYHFETEIEELLPTICDAYTKKVDQPNMLGLHLTSLGFRILRQHGYFISSDVFVKFTDGRGNFHESLIGDTRGLLSLYDAAYLRVHGEDILEKALVFTTAHLKSTIACQNEHPLAPQIARALVYPNHRGMIQIESRCYTSYYEQDPTHVKPFARFAKLEFDFMQSMYKKELQELTQWWRRLRISETLTFARERVTEAYVFSISIFYEPEYSVARVVYTNVYMLTSITDDMYDSHGFNEELEAFTEATLRWDKQSIDDLPEYMKRFYVIQYDTYKEIEDDLAKLRVVNNVHYAIQQVKESSKWYMKEARWREMNHVPTFDEYFENGIKSAAINMLVVVSMFFHDVQDSVAVEAIESVSAYCKPQKATCLIGRFMDDIVGHEWDKQRYHVAGGVACYVKQYGVTEYEAQVAITSMIEDAWKDMNEEILRPVTPVGRPLLAYLYNFCRTIDYFYKDEDAYTRVSQRMKDTMSCLFIEPVPL